MTKVQIKYIILLLGYFSSAFTLGIGGPQFFQRNIPKELHGVSISSPLRSTTLLESFKSSQLTFKGLKGGRLDLRMGGSKPLMLSGMPKVPQILRMFKVDPTLSAEAHLENVVLEETSVSVPLETAPEAYVWDLKQRLTFRPQTQDRYFPGKFVQSHQSKGVLWVNLFPVQVDLLTGKVLRVTSADIKVAYEEKDSRLSWGELFAVPSVIITSDKLKEAAQILKNYHEQKLGLKTAVITVEEIDKEESPISEKDLPSGYKDPSERENFIKPYQGDRSSGYDYELAKKISNYLQKRISDNSPLKYVTILGGSEEVPPSYYFAYSSNLGRNFTPTDACYGAIKECSEPKVAVGRLPLRDVGEVKNYVEKVEAWRAFSEKSSSELSLLGGKAFPSSDVYVGELGVLNAIQGNKLDWVGVKKHFKTIKSYSKDKLMEVVKAQSSSPFVYHLDHGNGNQLFAENEFVASKEITGFTLSSEPHPAIMVSVSCSNGAFDEALTKESLYNDNAYGDLSVGTELVRSKAGVPAYLGAARPALGMPIYQIDEFGNVELTGANYGLQILDSFYQKYGILRQGRLGDFSLKALQAFVFENGNDLRKDQNAWSYFTTVLLGDPVIPLPNRSKSADSFEIGKSLLKLDNSAGVGFPTLSSKEFKQDHIPLALAKSVSATLFKILENDFGSYAGEEQIISKVVEVSDSPKLDLTSSRALDEGTYFLRLENIEGVPSERQVYFKLEK